MGRDPFDLVPGSGVRDMEDDASLELASLVPRLVFWVGIFYM